MNASSCLKLDKSGWLDRIAIVMAVVCGIHCLVTPILLVALPIIGVTFWTDPNFHLWMLALVIPTTTLAAFSGCRKHKDRIVAACAAIGILVLITANATEIMALGPTDPVQGTDAIAEGSDCGDCCAVDAHADGLSKASLGLPSLSTASLLNLAGGLFLIAGHIRNFRLCRVNKRCDCADSR